MSQENVELVQRAYEAFNRGDRDAAFTAIAPDCEYVTTGAIPGAGGSYRGPEGFKRFTEWLLNQFDDGRIEVNEVIEAGDQVVVRATIRGRGKHSGVETSWENWHVWTVRDGKAIRGIGFTSETEALSAAGLSE
jgi:ketosteroid isomerase-like protein